MKTTQLQNQSHEVIPMERTHYVEESFAVRFVPEEDIQHVN